MDSLKCSRIFISFGLMRVCLGWICFSFELDFLVVRCFDISWFALIGLGSVFGVENGKSDRDGIGTYIHTYIIWELACEISIYIAG